MDAMGISKPHQRRRGEHYCWHNEPELLIVESLYNEWEDSEVQQPTKAVDTCIALCEGV